MVSGEAPLVSESWAVNGGWLGGEWWAVSGEWWVVSGEWWAVSGEWWVVSGGR